MHMHEDGDKSVVIPTVSKVGGGTLSILFSLGRTALYTEVQEIYYPACDLSCMLDIIVHQV